MDRSGTDGLQLLDRLADRVPELEHLQAQPLQQVDTAQTALAIDRTVRKHRWKRSRTCLSGDRLAQRRRTVLVL